MSFIETLQQTELGQLLFTFVVSMVPVLELRGAIPIGVSLGLDYWKVILVSIAGNMVPVPFIILFIRRIFEWLKARSPWLDRTVTKLESKAEGKWDKVHKYEVWGLFVLVAIPLPGTGAWTGALIAALMNIRMKSSVPAILFGVIGAAVIVTIITYGFTGIFA